MAGHTPWGPRPGESHRQYMDRLNDERLTRLAQPGKPLAPPISDAELAARQAEATARANAMEAPPEPAFQKSAHAWQNVGRSIGGVAGRVVDKVSWQRGRVYNPKVWSADLKTPR